MPERTFIIGDVHGCFRQMERLLECLSLAAVDQIVFLGDLVDRGPDSAKVIREIVRLSQKQHITAIKGNHEQMMLEARDSHDKSTDWILNGGDATLRSYAGARGTLRDVPSEHWTFLESGLVDYVETDTHILVHANAYPDTPMPEQPAYMLRWERFENIAPHESGKIIVCGHTPQKSGRPANRGYAICIDTHACGGGPLTCLESMSGRVWQVHHDGHVERSHISDFSEDSY